MAIWQIEIMLIPKNESGFENFDLNESSMNRLKLIFPPKKSWSDKLKVYGEYDEGTYVAIYCNDEKIEEIFSRISLLDLTKDKICAIVDFAKENQLMLLVDDDKIELTIEKIKDIIMKSDAIRFVTNPRGFFENLNNNSISN